MRGDSRTLRFMIEAQNFTDRYGLSTLSESQRNFLNNPLISEERDITGRKTLQLDYREKGEGNSLRIVDNHSYTLGRTKKPLSIWERERIPIYKKVSGDGNPEKIDDHTYLFKLEDGSLIQVEFLTIRESG